MADRHVKALDDERLIVWAYESRRQRGTSWSEIARGLTDCPNGNATMLRVKQWVLVKGYAWPISMIRPRSRIPPTTMHADGNAPDRGRYNTARGAAGNEWYTPPLIAAAARAVLGGIELDPASCAEANEIIQAERWLEWQHLGPDWTARSIFLNPPFSVGRLDHWVLTLMRAIEEKRVGAAILLVNNGTETRWGSMALEHCDAVCFHRGRIRFIRPGGDSKGTGRVGQMICYYGPVPGRFNDEFQTFGPCFVPQEVNGLAHHGD